MFEIKEEIIRDFIYHTPVGDNANYHISPKTVYDFLSSSSPKIKQIPKYQRPYSWDKKHLIDFLNDILDVSNLNLELKKTWFLGSIYTTQQQASQNMSSILDGQQRITSLQIILNEIKLSRFYDKSIEIENFQIQEDINQCLFYNQSGEKKPKFVTDGITNDFMNKYLMESKEINNYEQYEAFYSKFISDLETNTNQSKSINTLYENIKHTKSFILKKVLFNDDILGNKEEPIKPIDKVINFANSILYHFWLIEIPLIEESVSTQIFEGLNNRGKPLSLIDKLQFQSLTSGIKNEEKIKSGWGNLYRLIDKLNSSNRKQIFKSDEDYIKSLFLALNGKELDGDSDYLDFFKNNYLNDLDSLDSFFKKNSKTINFFIELNSEESQFLKFFEGKEKIKVKSILFVLNELIFQYKNTTILLLYVLDKVNIDDSDKYPLIQCIWSIIQLSAVENVFDGKKGPNKRRDSFLSLNKAAKGKLDNHQRLIHYIKTKNAELVTKDDEKESYDLSCIRLSNDKKIKSFKYLRPLNDSSGLLNTKNNEDASLVLYLYILVTQHENLNIYSKNHMKSSHLEHIFPRAWQKHWSNKCYTIDEVSDYLESIGADELKKLISDDSIEFELKDYRKPYKQNESLIEWIGNKMILDGPKNQQASNKSFDEKIYIYNKQNKVMLPSNENGKLNFDDKTDFDFKKIIDRSIVIVETLSKQFLSMGWDEID